MIFRVRRNQIKNPWVIFLIAVLSFFVAGVIIFRLLDFSAFKDSLRQASNEPAQVIIALGVFFVAFLFRAIAWKKVLPSISLGQSLAGIHLSLGANHVLPLRLGEPFRILSIIKRSNTSLDAATASTVTLRSADILSVIIIGIVVAPSAFSDLLGWVGWLLVSAIAIVAIGSWRWLKKIVQSNTAVRLPGPLALGLSASAWLLESVLVWQCAHWAGLDVSWNDALLVLSLIHI